MKTKKITLIVIATLIIILASAIGYIYWTQLRGIGPAITKPPVNIAEIIPPEPTSNIDIPLKLPKDFSISIYAKNVPNARLMAWAPEGIMLVSSPSEGKIFALIDKNNDGSAETIEVAVSGLNKPHGLAFRCTTPDAPCQLYIAETSQLAIWDWDQATHHALNKKKLLDFPADGNHFTRTIMFMPSPDENKLLISIGSDCNVCHEDNPLRASIQVYDIVTSKLSEFAKGLRNSVFMAIHPVNGKIWATEMGRDLLGDNIPPDEINIIEQGKNYGWPICYGQNIHDTEFDHNTYIRNPCMAPFETPSYIDIQAHSAPLGLAFIPEEGWPQDMWYNALVAYHGSWNRTEPTGYKIVRYKLDQYGNVLGSEDFITGWLKDGKALGRPVDIITHPGGVIYISDDKAGVIYKVQYHPSTTAQDNSNLIQVNSPTNDQLITSPFTVTGKARGSWYFEASFPVILQDANGKILAQQPAQAKGEWMTTEFVPFESVLTFEKPTTDTGTLILKKDNPSGLPENDAEISIPVKFK